MVKIVLYVVWLVGLMVVVACGRVATPPPSPVENTAVAATSISTLPAPTLTPTLSPSPEPSSTVTPIPLPTVTPTATLPQGILFGIDSDKLDQDDGIWRLDLSTNEKVYLLRESEDWITWSARFSSNSKWVVYWVQKETTAEIWVSSLLSRNPELLLTLPETRDDFVLLSWLTVDKYILLEFIKYTEPFSAYTDRTKVYLLDRYDHQIKYASIGLDTNDALGYYTDAETCGLLAVSPITSRVSVWCKMSKETPQYTVVEVNGELWISQQHPQRILEERNYGTDLLVWSGDGTYLAYSAGDSRDFIYYVQANKFEPTKLSDIRTASFQDLVFSPDNLYLAYLGRCVNPQCAIISDLESNQIIWTDYVQNHGYPTNYFWSPDSRYFGYYFPSEGIHIIDIHSKEIVMQLPASADIVVWVVN